MPQLQKAKILGIHISERDRYAGKPLYEAIVQKCRELRVAGATVLRGVEGYGETAEIHRAHLIGHNLPIVITIIDTEANLKRLIPVLDSMLDTGLMAISEVEMIRVQKTPTTPNV